MKQLPLSQGLFAVVDDEDWDRIAAHKWCALRTRRNVYGARRLGARTIYLHRAILDAPKGLEVDHIDHDGLNCVRSNLRLTTRSQNAQNQGDAHRDSLTGVRGVCFDRTAGRYKATIVVNYRQIGLGYFKDLHAAEEAAIAGRARLMTHSAECNETARESA